MSKFSKKAKSSQDIPTAALPDIIFMLLFFFMVSTVIRENSLMVEQKIPLATQLKKLEKKSLVANLYIGKPKEVEKWGKEPKIQVNDILIEPEAVPLFVNTFRSKIPDYQQSQITMAMNVDKEAKMGIIVDVQEQLRKSNARKVLYKTLESAE